MELYLHSPNTPSWRRALLEVQGKLHTFTLHSDYDLCAMLFNMTILPVSVWAWNLVSHIKGSTYSEGVWEQGADENIWT
jgi:hypothetical protein